MFPIILERDTRVNDWLNYGSWPTAYTLLTTSTMKVRSDGVLNTDYANVSSRGTSGVITARSTCAIGVHLTGPLPGSEFTCYQISAACIAADPTVKSLLFIGESPATITNNAGGDTVTAHRLLRTCESSGAEGSMLNVEMTVALPVLTDDLGTCFGIALLAGSGASSDLTAYMHMSVRRLIGINPAIIDTRKL